MPTILVSGAASGIGAAFIKAYSDRPGYRVLAVDQTAAFHFSGSVEVFQVDVRSSESIESFTKNVRTRPIDVLIHCAGIRGLVPAAEYANAGDITSCENLEVMDDMTMIHAFQVNVVGAFMLLRALLPNLRMASNPKVIVMSSRMGSISNNQFPNKDAGGAYAYRSSKAALNAVVRSLAVDIPDIAFILCHPGRVETKLVKWKEDGAIKADESVGQLIALIERWDRSDTGKFYDRFGESIPW